MKGNLDEGKNCLLRELSLVLVVGIFFQLSFGYREKGSLEGEVWGENEPLVGAVV